MIKHKFKVLVADDEPENLNLLQQTFREEYRLFFAKSGKKALEIAEKNSPDLILLDIVMPEMDGMQTCQKLKENPNLKDIPVIFLSALDDPEEIALGFELGGVDYVTKPFNSSEIRARVKIHLELKQSKDEIKEKNESLYSKNKALEVASEELQKYAEIGALVAAVVHDAKKFTVAMSMSLRDLVLPTLQDNVSHQEDWVLDIMNDLNEAVYNSDQCTEFLESLLTMHRDEDIGNVNVVEIAQKAVNLLSYNLQKDKIAWSINFEEGVQYHALANSQLIRVFMNLVANAHDALKRYAVEEPRITVGIAKTADNIIVSVHDNGPGMPKEVLENLRKGIAISTKGKGGNGLGVSGATKMIKLYGGDMKVESEIGEGATFQIILNRVEDGEKKELTELSDEIEFF